MEPHNLTDAWLFNLRQLLERGEEVAPRGKRTKELLHHTTEVDMRRPVLMVPERKLSYRFMAAEAYWMLVGDRSVEGIAPWNRNIAQFSDDGKVFFGPYGHKILDQLPYVVNKLLDDPDSRQAVLTIWRESPPPTKDVPCTVAMAFSIRRGRLNAHVFMRSNDLWLGQPYDAFNFSMTAHLVCAKLNRLLPKPVSPGTLYLTAASLHLYEEHWEAAEEIRRHTAVLSVYQPETPPALWCHADSLLDWLKKLRESRPGDIDRWWEDHDEQA